VFIDMMSRTGMKIESSDSDGRWVYLTTSDERKEAKASGTSLDNLLVASSVPVAPSPLVTPSHASSITLLPKSTISHRTHIRARGKLTLTSLPPEIRTSRQVNAVLRFQNTSASLVGVSSGQLAAACGGIATGSTTVTTWASSIKLHTVHVWPASGGFVSLFWTRGTGEFVPDDMKDATIPTGVTSTSMSRFSPPSLSLAGFWHNVDQVSTGLFSISSTVGSVIDVHVTYTLTNQLPTMGNVTVTSASVGLPYYLALDGPTSNVYVPVAVPTTH